MLGLLGAAVPDDFLPGREDHQKGYFDGRRIVAFHDRLLEKLGSRWDDPLPLAKTCFDSAVTKAAVQELCALVKEDFGDQSIVLVKDPRMCRLVPVWIDALAHANWRTVAVLPLRHPLEVAASLRRRTSFSRPHALALWLQHVLLAEHATRATRRCFTLYDDLLSDWWSVARKIDEELGLGWPRERFRVKDQIDAFLSSELRHHHVAEDDLLAPDALQDLCLRAWEALKLLVSDPGNTQAQTTLDEISREFHAALSVFGPLIASLDRSQIQSQAAIVALNVSHAKALGAAELSRAESRAKIGALERQKTELSATLENRIRVGEELQAALAHEVDKALEMQRSTLWRAFSSLRHRLSRLPKPLRTTLRWCFKGLYWSITPHRISQRLSIMSSRAALTKTKNHEGLIQAEPLLVSASTCFRVEKAGMLGEGCDVMVLVVFSADGTLSDLQQHQISSHVAAGYQVVLMVNTNTLYGCVIGDVTGAEIIIIRENLGYDFGAWRDALALIGGLDRARSLSFTNDSVLPLSVEALRATREKCLLDPGDVIFLTRNDERRPHGQSYFMMLKRSALDRDAQALLAQVPNFADKFDLIRGQEIHLSDRFAALGLRVGVLYHSDAAEAQVVNPTIHHWEELVANGFPYLKVQIFAQGFLTLDDPRVTGHLSASTSAMLKDHLAKRTEGVCQVEPDRNQMSVPCFPISGRMTSYGALQTL